MISLIDSICKKYARFRIIYTGKHMEFRLKFSTYRHIMSHHLINFSRFEKTPMLLLVSPSFITVLISLRDVNRMLSNDVIIKSIFKEAQGSNALIANHHKISQNGNH